MGVGVKRNSCSTGERLELGMVPLSVVEDLDVLEKRVREVDPGAPFLPVQQLNLHR